MLIVSLIYYSHTAVFVLILKVQQPWKRVSNHRSILYRFHFVLSWKKKILTLKKGSTLILRLLNMWRQCVPESSRLEISITELVLTRWYIKLCSGFFPYLDYIYFIKWKEAIQNKKAKRASYGTYVNRRKSDQSYYLSILFCYTTQV